MVADNCVTPGKEAGTSYLLCNFERSTTITIGIMEMQCIKQLGGAQHVINTHVLFVTAASVVGGGVQ